MRWRRGGGTGTRGQGRGGVDGGGEREGGGRGVCKERIAGGRRYIVRGQNPGVVLRSPCFPYPSTSRGVRRSCVYVKSRHNRHIRSDVLLYAGYRMWIIKLLVAE